MQSTLTQQALLVDEQSLAQEELNDLLVTQSETVAPTQDPLTHRDRQIIATIINSTPDQIKTIWIEGGITVWVQLSDSGRLPFDKNWFASRVAEVKPTIAEPEPHVSETTDYLTNSKKLVGSMSCGMGILIGYRSAQKSFGMVVWWASSDATQKAGILDHDCTEGTRWLILRIGRLVIWECDQ